MYNQYTLQDLAKEVERQQAAKRDFIAPVFELSTHSEVQYEWRGTAH